MAARLLYLSRRAAVLTGASAAGPLRMGAAPLLGPGRSALSTAADKPRVAVVFSGCGVFDGTEIHEAAACLAALTRNGATPIGFAPEVQQAHVVNHLTGSVDGSGSVRCVRAESARITRGASVRPLSELRGADPEVAALVFPGGFGVAKNLCDFAFNGGDKMTVNPDVVRVIEEFLAARKPMAFCCIAPILAAKVVPGATLTMGRQGAESEWPHGGAIGAARSMGGNMVEMGVDEVAVDTVNRIVSNPAFMYNGEFHEIQDGVSKMIKALLEMVPR